MVVIVCVRVNNGGFSLELLDPIEALCATIVWKLLVLTVLPTSFDILLVNSRQGSGIAMVVLLIGIGSLPALGALCIWCIYKHSARARFCCGGDGGNDDGGSEHYPSSAEFSTEELSSESSPQPEFLEFGLDDSRFSARDHSPSHHKIDHDYSTTDFYPKIVLGESWTFPRPEDSTCSICIHDYQPNETLKFIPECYHSFHVECIDLWLCRNVACPVCRNTPFPSEPTASYIDDCSNSTCSGENLVEVRFPFRLKDRQPEHCGYPGFNLICNSVGKTVMLLPYSGEFSVRQINYVKQEIHFYDSDNCLPRRLLDFNISEFPRFKSVYYQNYTFLNCSSEFEATKLKHIDCLSSKGHNVLATASMTNLGNVFSTECEVIKTVSVPVQFPIAYERGFSSNLENDLILGWDEPDCWGCTAMGWQCRSVSGNSSQTRCFAVPPHGSSTPKPSNNNDFHNKITLAVALPTVIVVLVFCACLCASSSRRQVSTTVSPQPPDMDFDITTVGLDGITIESYPKLIIGDSCRVPVPNGNTCPICLNEYYSKEILRSMPDCKHCFHADCIDEWLLINAACPLCRDCPSVLDREPPSSPIP